MIRTAIYVLVGVSLLALHSPSFLASECVDPGFTAKVNLRFISAANGDDLGTGTVTAFENVGTGQDYAVQFRQNSTGKIPYGTYYLRAHQEGFWSTRRIVEVRAPEVTVFAGVHLGVECGPYHSTVAGTIRGRGTGNRPMRVRLVGLHSSDLRDAWVDSSGRFSFDGLAQGRYVLVVLSGNDVLHTRSLENDAQAGELQIVITK